MFYILATGMQARHCNGEVRIFRMLFLNLANQVAVEIDRNFNDVNKSTGLVKKEHIRLFSWDCHEAVYGPNKKVMPSCRLGYTLCVKK